MVYYECNGCRAVLESASELIGKPDRCPDCGTVNVVPRASLPRPRKAPCLSARGTPARPDSASSPSSPQAVRSGFSSGWIYGLGFAVGLLTMLQLSGVFGGRSGTANRPSATNAASVSGRHRAAAPSTRYPAVSATGAEAKALAEVRDFIEKGGDLNGDYGKGLTVLHWAARHGYVEVAKFLIDKGANVDARERAVGRATPLHIAAVYGHRDIAKLLLDKGASVDSTEQYGSTPLQYAAFNGHNSLIELLLEKGADVKHRDTRYGITALHAAVAGRKPSTVELLIARGADVNARSDAGETPLGTALRTGQAAIAAAFRSHGGKQ